MPSDFDRGAKRPLLRDAGDFGPLASAQQWMGVCGRYWSDRLDALIRLLRGKEASKCAPPKQRDQ